MDRKKFLKKGLLGLGTIIAIPTVVTSCSSDDDNNDGNNDPVAGDCELSPIEVVGPFPIKTPSDYVRENIIGDRAGIALLITLTIQEKNNNCAPLSGVYVDLWQCDAQGDYSEYGGTFLQNTDYTNNHFLRGRQTTDANGQVSFISIFPGWYNGRATHLHVEVLDQNESSIRVTQIAFPKDVCDTVYATAGYNGEADTSNETDNYFADSLEHNMLDSITGNTTDGYTLLKTIVV